MFVKIDVLLDDLLKDIEKTEKIKKKMKMVLNQE